MTIHDDQIEIARIIAEPCQRCGHTGNLHRLDDAQNVGPTDPAALFRCLGYDPALPAPPVAATDCTECGISNADCLDRVNTLPDFNGFRCCWLCGLADVHNILA
jgi:hypothetical protein